MTGMQINEDLMGIVFKVEAHCVDVGGTIVTALIRIRQPATAAEIRAKIAEGAAVEYFRMFPGRLLNYYSSDTNVYEIVIEVDGYSIPVEIYPTVKAVAYDEERL